MRRTVLLAGGALLAAAGLFMSSGAGPKRSADKAAASAPPMASINGAPLDPPPAAADETQPSAAEVTTFQQLAEKTAKKVVDAGVTIDLDKLKLEDGRYVAPTKDGRRAVLTLDPDLQQLAEKLLNQSRAPRGAIVAMAPDGRILAFAGRRTAEPKGGTQGIFDYHLATDVWAPAASVFKLVTASALVSNGYDPTQKVCYHGGVRSVMESNLVDSKSDNNCETLGYGVAHSNNAILGKLAFQNLDPKRLDRTARDLGWANVLPASLGVKATCGELALPQEKDLEFAKAAAGFNGSRLSVLGGAVLAATFADDGEQPVPRIVESIAGRPVDAPKSRRVLDKKVAQAVAEMMVGTCQSGSAAKSFRRGRTVTVAGKTGTLATDKPFFMEHSWFVGFAPAEQPEIVVSVLLGNPESWHLKGHEAAKRMIDRAMRRAGDRDDEADARPTRPAKRVK